MIINHFCHVLKVIYSLICKDQNVDCWKNREILKITFRLGMYLKYLLGSCKKNKTKKQKQPKQTLKSQPFITGENNGTSHAGLKSRLSKINKEIQSIHFGTRLL